eukprot:13695089-Alexandrium_andersonii.AAC.1
MTWARARPAQRACPSPHAGSTPSVELAFPTYMRPRQGTGGARRAQSRARSPAATKPAHFTLRDSAAATKMLHNADARQGHTTSAELN